MKQPAAPMRSLTGDRFASADRPTMAGTGLRRRIIKRMTAPNPDRAESPSPHAPAERPADADLPALLAARARHQQRRNLMLTPQERMAAMQKLIDQSWAVLQAKPKALAHFRARNHHKRAIAVGELAQHGT